jgi:hypothetical protein
MFKSFLAGKHREAGASKIARLHPGLFERPNAEAERTNNTGPGPEKLEKLNVTS